MPSKYRFSQASVKRVRARLASKLEEDELSMASGIRAVIDADENPFGPLAWLMVKESNPRVRGYARTLLFTALQASFVPHAVKEVAREEVLPVLLDALRGTDTTDDDKLMIRVLLTECGHEIPEDEFRAFLIDFDAAVERQLDSIRDLRIGLPELSACLEKIGIGPLEDRPEDPNPREMVAVIGMALQMMSGDPLAGSAAICTIAAAAHEHGYKELSIQPLDVVRMQGGPHGRWFLSVLAAQPGRGETGEYAARLAAAMGEEGLSANPPRAGSFSHGMLTAVDGAGSRGLMLFFRTDEGTLDGLTILLNDITGIREYLALWGTAADSKFVNGEKLIQAPCDQALASEVFGDALAIMEALDSPPPAHSILTWHLFGEGGPVAKRREPRLGPYLLETIVRSPDMARGSDQLVDDPIWVGIGNPTDASYDLLRSNLKRLKGRGHSHTAGLESSLFDEFLALQEKHGKEALLHRMAVNLEIAALAGKAKQSQNRLACRTWLALSENVVPFASVPYVRALARKEVLMADGNIRSGYHNQRAANDKRLEMDEKRDRERWENTW